MSIDLSPFYADYVREWNSITLDQDNDTLTAYSSFSTWTPAVASGTTNALLSTTRCGSQTTGTTVEVLLLTSFVFNTDGGALDKVVLSGLPSSADSGTVYSIDCLVIQDDATSPMPAKGTLSIDPATSSTNLEILGMMDFVENKTYYVKGVLSYQSTP